MADLTAAGAIAIAIEQVMADPQVLVERDSVLDQLIAENGRAEMVSAHTYRLTFQDAIPANISAIALDNAAVNFPTPGSSSWQQGTMAPVSWALPVGWTKLMEIAGKPNLTVVNGVMKQMADTIDAVARYRDIFICAGDGTGFLGNITAVDSGNKIYTMNNNDFGARLLSKNMAVDVYNGTTLLGTSNILSVTQSLGSVQTVTVDSVPGSTAAGSILRVPGLASGAPAFVYGIPYWLSNATTGLTVGLDRSVAANNFIISNGVNAASSAITPPLLRLPMDQIKQALGLKAVQNGKLKIQTHTGQKAAYEAIAGQMMTITRPDGKASTGYDLLYQGDPSVSGCEVIENIHAHMQRWDFLNTATWGKIKWGNPPFWFTSEGRKVFQQVGTNGQITAGAASFMVDTVNYYNDNPKSQSSIYAAKQPAGY
ncbi:MAG TPA: hypothetical protein VGU67_02945 [Edaphobacter sp.]|nr:hypothetical protein [Edaphobacter sp.]